MLFPLKLGSKIAQHAIGYLVLLINHGEGGGSDNAATGYLNKDPLAFSYVDRFLYFKVLMSVCEPESPT
jgi:hypothetical protein